MKPKRVDLPYRPCVGVMVFNRLGKVWAGRRRMRPSQEVDSLTLWQMPQGGIDRGEEPLDAAKRELYEETGMRSVSLLAEAPGWITYELPAHLIGLALGGRYRGQKQKWFAFRFEGNEAEIRIDPPPDGGDPEFESWAWQPIDRLPDIVVPFKRDVYKHVLSAFRHLAPPVRAQTRSGETDASQ